MTEHRSQGRTATTIARIWFAVLALVIAASLVIQLVLIFTGGADANSGAVDTTDHVGVRLVRLFSYFTIQSNILVLATAVILMMKPLRDGRVWRVVRLDSLLAIAITGLVFATILAPIVHLTGAALVATIGFHYVSPVLAIVGWLIFGPRPRFTWGTVAAAFIWPAAWLVYTFVHGYFTDWYPYPFLDVTELGLTEALRNSLIVVAVAGVFSVIIKTIDRWLPAVLSTPD